MHRHPSKRQQLIQRIIIYSAMSVAVLALVAVLLFVVLGYRLNQTDGRIEQGGLMQFESRPSGAEVRLDGNLLGVTTAKATVGSGQHSVVMSRGGYHPWQKTVTMEPGAILWLNYARLIPNDLKIEDVTELQSVTSSVASPDDKWVAIKQKSDDAIITLADVSRETVKTTNLELPATSFTPPATGKPHSFSLETWDAASRYLLVRHTYNDGATEWLVVDSENPSQAKNITALLGVNISRALFSPANSTLLYAQVGHDVRKIDLDALTISRPLVGNVAEFALYGRSTLVFTSLPDATTKVRSVGYYEDGSDKVHTLRTYADTTMSLHIALDKYFEDYYIAIAVGDAVEIVTSKKLPVNEAEMAQLKPVARYTQPGGVDSLEARTSGRFIVANKGTLVQVYDLELKTLTQTTLKGETPITRQLGWLDNYHMWSDFTGMLRLYEFDSENQHDIMPVIPGQAVTLSPDGVYLYGITRTEGGTHHLTRVRLILP